MDSRSLEKLASWFESYALSFKDASGRLSKAAECKLVHTMEVKAHAAKIAREGAGLSGSALNDAEAAGLLHDVARFEQYRDFKTFHDSKSFDHGDAGVRIILRERLLEPLAEEARETILEAVRVHNKALLPEGMAPGRALVAKIVRDADKVGIMDFISKYFEDDSYWKDPAIQLDMPDTPGFTMEIAETVLSGNLIKHSQLRCVNDFKISMFAWSFDLNYPVSGRMLFELGAFARLRSAMPQDPVIDKVCSMVEARLRAFAGEMKAS